MTLHGTRDPTGLTVACVGCLLCDSVQELIAGVRLADLKAPDAPQPSDTPHPAMA
jgi:hypothetical protein